ncbi:MAG: hypothetical protein F6K22_02500 [Okeania sp. SIO2F4]|uniref:hypothetical protein n=1 Tax=Okeania sp. SIO2F4 TaxID=2607790 RepID=UPI00142A0192|nr:hypothetical protein [Okeania sp. SIO2F4]NES01793.1 hypothetical protein [Okeania sp. SIO2F4]
MVSHLPNFDDDTIFKSLCTKGSILSAYSGAFPDTVAETKPDENNKFDTEVVEASKNSNKFHTETAEASDSSKSNLSQKEVGSEKTNARTTTKSKTTRK